MNSNAIVTLADSNYFELLEELIDSIKFQNKENNVSICVLDAGLTENQINTIKVETSIALLSSAFCNAAIDAIIPPVLEW